jgi:hypothetical protein
MTKATYIQLAPIRLKAGHDEASLIAASDAFQASFVSKQTGIVQRILVRGNGGGYADLVFFESKADAERVAQAERTSEPCAEFFDVIEPPDPALPDMGVLSFEHVKTYR